MRATMDLSYDDSQIGRRLLFGAHNQERLETNLGSPANV